MYIGNFLKRIGIAFFVLFSIISFTAFSFMGLSVSASNSFLPFLVIGEIVFFVLSFTFYPNSLWKDGEKHLVKTFFLGLMTFLTLCFILYLLSLLVH